jgi:hypothetical protein
MTNTHGGLRQGSGRPKGTTKGQKKYEYIKVEKSFFLELKNQKIKTKSKNWTEFLLDLINKKDLS